MIIVGIILLAKCECRYEETIRADRGKIVSGPTCNVPAYCEKCKAVVSINMLKKKRKCPTCKNEVVIYNDPSLNGAKTIKSALKWGMDLEEDFELPKSHNKCPKCGQMSLEFHKVGNWD